MPFDRRVHFGEIVDPPRQVLQNQAPVLRVLLMKGLQIVASSTAHVNSKGVALPRALESLFLDRVLTNPGLP